MKIELYNFVLMVSRDCQAWKMTHSLPAYSSHAVLSVIGQLIIRYNFTTLRYCSQPNYHIIGLTAEEFIKNIFNDAYGTFLV